MRYKCNFPKDFISNRCFLLLWAGVVLSSFVACTSQPDHKAETARHLSAVLGAEHLSYSYVEVAERRNIEIVEEDGEQALAFHLFPGQPRLNNGIRSEISIDFPHQLGDHIRYTWEMKLPEGFTADVPKNRWWVVAQWHDQPNRELNETWEEFPSRSPTIGLALGEIQGELGLVLVYGRTAEGVPQKVSSPMIIQRGQWHRIEATIAWAEDASGTISWSLDGENVLNLVGPNMNNDFQHYLKLGMYRHPDIQLKSTMFIKNVTMTQVQP